MRLAALHPADPPSARRRRALVRRDLTAETSSAQTLTFDSIPASRPTASAPNSWCSAPAASALTYAWDDGRGRKLWAMAVGDGKRAPLVDFAALQPAKEGEKGFAPSSYEWSSDGRRLLFLAGGDLFALAPGGTAPRRLTETAADEPEPEVAPTAGASPTCARPTSTCSTSLRGSEEALTTDGKPGEILNATTDWVYWEEIWGRRPEAFWWSPDGSAHRLLPLRRPRGADLPGGRLPRHLSESRAAALPEGRTDQPRGPHRCPRPLDPRDHLDADRADPTEYLVRLAWAPDSRRVAIEKLNRGQDRLELFACERAAGACKPILVETWPTWVNLGEELHWLADGSWLWGSEREGWRHLYRVSAGGETRRLTPEGWAMASLDGVVESAGIALVTAYPIDGLGPAGRQVLAVRLDGSGPRALSEGRGWHTAQAVSPRGYGSKARATPMRRDPRACAGSTVRSSPSCRPCRLPASISRRCRGGSS